MAVLTAKKIADGRGGDEEFRGNKTVRSYTDVYRVVTNNFTDEAAVVRSILPQIGSVYSFDARAFLRRVSTSQSIAKTVWIANLFYSTEFEVEPDPTDDPARITWGFEKFQRAVFEDKDGKGIVNSAGDPFDPTVMIDDSRQIVTLRKNLGFVPSWILTYRDAVNLAAFTVDGVSVGARIGKIDDIQISEVQERNDIFYRALTLKIAMNPDTWDTKVLDQGFRKKDPSDGTKRNNIISDDGTDPAKPVLLDGSGAVLANPTAATAVFLEFTILKEKDFSVLPLT